jgi:hypothetical protein
MALKMGYLYLQKFNIKFGDLQNEQQPKEGNLLEPQRNVMEISKLFLLIAIYS